MGPQDVVQRWLSAWAMKDRDSLVRLVPPTSVVHASEPAELAGDYTGFAEAERYFLQRAELVEGFTWEAGDALEAGPFVVVPFRLSDADGREWWQVGVYRIDDDHIAEIWLHEPPSRPTVLDGREGASG